jgi:hypothetical protein
MERKNPAWELDGFVIACENGGEWPEENEEKLDCY